MTLPPARPGRVPNFNELGDEAFEDLCRDLVQEEPIVETADRYGTRGQSEHGIDILIQCKDGSLVTGQCKSHKRCTESLIRTACDEFLAHADHWRTAGARVFVLFLAADTRRRQMHAERLVQRQRLRQAGFEFVVWSGAVLVAKLRKQRQIVRHYMPWLEPYICGPETQIELHASRQAATIQVLAGQLAERAESDHDEFRRLWQDGHPTEALAKLRKFRAEPDSWHLVPPATKAKLLRLEGRLVLTSGKIVEAKQLAAEADQLHAHGGGRLRAMIAQAEGRLTDAIDVLGSDTDPDSQALKAAIQIQARRIDEALATLSGLVEHPDAHRLRAIVFLSQGAPDRAKAEAEKALALAPTWYWMRRTAAMIRYLAGLSPVAVPRGVPEWPEPVNPSLVRHDDESIAARCAAAAEFSALSDAQFEHSAEELACLQAWHIACLADNTDTRSRAEEMARTVLAATPANHRVLTWVVARGLDVEIEASMNALRTGVDTQTATVEEVIGLVASYAMRDRFEEAERTLSDTRETFVREAALGLWDLWKTQIDVVHAAHGGDQGAGDLTARLERTLAELRNTKRDGDREGAWHQYVLLARLGRWDEVAPAARELVSALQTADAARMASYALYNTRDFGGCLAILDDAPRFFPKSELPRELRRLRVLAQRAVGALTGAIEAAGELFEESPTRETLLDFARLLFEVGDFKSLVLLARQHTDVVDLTALDFLTLAIFVKNEDSALALALWQRAVQQGIDDDHVGTAFEVGSNLGAGVELKQLVHRITALGAVREGGVRAVSFDEFREWALQRRDHLDRTWQALRLGEAPYHVAMAILGVELATVFHRLPLRTKSRIDGVSEGPVFQRFGGRSGDSVLPIGKQTWRLNADLTALLSAAHFGLLPLIEAHFSPIRIPQHTILALGAMRDKLRPGQPDRLEAKRQVLSAAAEGRIAKVDLRPVTRISDIDGDIADDILQLLHEAVASDALVLDFLPPRAENSPESAKHVAPRYAELLRDAHSVVDALAAAGTLSISEHRATIERLGLRHGVPTHSAVPVGRRIVCRAAVVELLALSGALDLAAATFKLAIPTHELEADRREVDSLDTGAADAEWIALLIERLRAGLSTGLYEALGHSEGPPPRGDEDHVPTPTEAVMFELMQFQGGGYDVIWCDDRWMTSHAQRDSIPIASSIDLLLWLRDVGKLPEVELREVLTDMRAADVRFVPFDEEELLSEVLAAPIQEGRLIETKPLRVLRQYCARCVLEADMLRPPVAGVLNAGTEWNFLLGSGLSIVTATIRVWEELSEDEAAIRANWLLRNLYTDDRGVHGTSADRPYTEDAYRVSVSLVSLVASAVRLDGKAATTREARRRYLTWLYHRLIRPRFDADAAMIPTFVEQLKGTMTQSIETRDEPLRAVTATLMHKLWSDLPEELRSLLSADQDFLATLGVAMTAIVEVGPLRLERKPLWQALANALSSGAATELTTVDGHRVRVALVREKPPVFLAQCPELKYDAHLGGDEYGFLSESFTDREGAAQRVSHWFDAPDARRQELIARVVGGQDASSRIELALETRRASGEHFYRRLIESIKEGEIFRPAQAIPSDPRILLSHLRIDESESPSDRWSGCAERLIADVGVIATARRLGGLPILVPNAIVTAVDGLSNRERWRALHIIRKNLLASPVGTVQFADLLSRLQNAERDATRYVPRLIAQFCGDEQRALFNAWLAVIRWVDEQLGFVEAVRTLPSDVRLGLVWTHGDRLFRILHGRGLPFDWISEAFERDEHPLGAELVFPDLAQSDDIAAPRRIHAEAFVLAALAHIGSTRHVSDARAALTGALERLSDKGRALALHAMLGDNTRARNALGSWLADGRAWVNLLPGELQTLLTPESIKVRIAGATAAILQKSEERSAWLELAGIIGTLPPSEEARFAIESITAPFDVAEYAGRDPWLAAAAVNAIAAQALYLSIDSRRRFEEQLILLASKIPTMRLDSEVREPLDTSIMAGLLACTWWHPAGEDRAHAFSSVLEQLVTLSPEALVGRGRFILRLCDALPVKEARHFWRVRDLLRLRGQQ